MFDAVKNTLYVIPIFSNWYILKGINWQNLNSFYCDLTKRRVTCKISPRGEPCLWGNFCQKKSHVLPEVKFHPGVQAFLWIFLKKFHNSYLCNRTPYDGSRITRLTVFYKKTVLKNFAKFTGKRLCRSLFFDKVAGGVCNFIKREPLTLVFSLEFCEILRTSTLKNIRERLLLRLLLKKTSLGDERI